MSLADKPKHVLLTGGTGAVGHRVLDELLKAGYQVRATARPAKVHYLTDTFPHAGDQLQVVEMQDILTGDWKQTLEGIDAVIHVATPVYHPWVTPEDLFMAATVGLKRLLTAVVESQTVTRFILTGSTGVFFKPDLSNVFQDVTFNENTYSDIETIDPKTADPATVYIGAKVISEKMLWEAADQHPHIDFTAVHPSSVYGRYIDTYPYPASDDDLNANKFLYKLIKPQDHGDFPPIPWIAVVDNKDCAKAHVLALTGKRLTDGRRKRLIISSGDMRWDDAVNFLKEKRPELAHRLPDITGVKLPSHYFKVDSKLTEEITGMKVEEMIKWQDTLLEVMDWLLEREKKLAAKSA